METTVTVIKTKEQLLADLQNHFAPFRAQAAEWMEKASAIEVTDESQTELMEEARICRLAMRKVRIGVENLHKEMKAESLVTGQVLDEIKRTLVKMIEPIEERLEKQEKFAEVQEAMRKEQLFRTRFESLQPFMGDEAKKMALGELDQNVFDAILKGCHAKAEQEKANEEALRKERDLKEKEQQEIRNENIRLREVQAINENRINKISTLGFIYSANDRSYIFPGTSVNISVDEVKALKDDEWTKLIGAITIPISEYREKKQREEEEQAAEKVKLEKKLERERAESKRLREEAEQVERDQEAERKRQGAEKRRLQRAPDKDKLLLLAEQTCYPKDPGLKDEEAVKLFEEFLKRMKAVGGWMEAKAREL